MGTLKSMKLCDQLWVRSDVSDDFFVEYYFLRRGSKKLEFVFQLITLNYLKIDELECSIEGFLAIFAK